jgi:hypothetical protein
MEGIGKKQREEIEWVRSKGNRRGEGRGMVEEQRKEKEKVGAQGR